LLGRAFAIEFGYSALLAFVIMGVATDNRAPAGVGALGVEGPITQTTGQIPEPRISQ
jgi:glycerol uptake facilitator-like aquaporin